VGLDLLAVEQLELKGLEQASQNGF